MTPQERKVMELALEALVLNNDEWKSLADSGDSGYWKAEDQDHYKQTNEAITAIENALAQPEQLEGLKLIHKADIDLAKKRALEAQPEQEPVAWRFQSPVGGWAYGKEPPIGSKYAVEPLYATPPQRKPLVIDSDEKATKHMNEKLFEFLDIAMMFPKAKADLSVWERVIIFAPQRTWVGLTDEELELLNDCGDTDSYKFARAIEAELKGRNT